MSAKRYCQLVGLLMLAALWLAAAFNLFVDPVGAYPAWHLKTFERQRATVFTRIARAELARRGDWEMAVFGTSRPKAGMPLAHPALATNRVCNLAVDAARMSEVSAMIDYTRARNPLRRVVLCLDFAMFRGSTFYQFDFAESRFNPRLSLFEYHCKNLIGANTTDQSWRLVLERWQHHNPPENERNGFHVRELKPDASQRALFDKLLRSLAYGNAVLRAATNEMDALRHTVEISRGNSIELNIAINPVHALDLELLVAGNNWDQFEQWKRDVVTMVANANATNVFVWDFSGYSEPATEPVPAAGDATTRMKYYFESSHYTPALGALMLDRMFLNATNDFGGRISATNIEQHLRRIREQREVYAREHRAEIEWAQRISQQALAARKRNPPPADDVE